MSDAILPQVDCSSMLLVKPIFQDAVSRLGWQEITSMNPERTINCSTHIWIADMFPETWKLLVQRGDLLEAVKISKFPGSHIETSKIFSCKSMRIMQRLNGDLWNFYPKSWILPQELADLKRESDGILIVKPGYGDLGQGMRLTDNVHSLTVGEPELAQEYVDDILLLENGKKFDLRLHVLLANLSPMQIYIARDSCARFCNDPYENLCGSVTNANMFSHITNTTFNARGTNYDSSAQTVLLSTMMDKFAEMGANVDDLWKRIEQVVGQAIASFVPQLMFHNERTFGRGRPQPKCFEFLIFGVDVLVTKDFDLRLLEVNVYPTFDSDNASRIYQEADLPFILDALQIVENGDIGWITSRDGPEFLRMISFDKEISEAIYISFQLINSAKELFVKLLKDGEFVIPAKRLSEELKRIGVEEFTSIAENVLPTRPPGTSLEDKIADFVQDPTSPADEQARMKEEFAVVLQFLQTLNIQQDLTNNGFTLSDFVLLLMRVATDRCEGGSTLKEKLNTTINECLQRLVERQF